MAQNLKELGAPNMKTRKTNTKTRTAMSWEKLELTFESRECGNIANAVWKRVPKSRSSMTK